MKKIILIIIAVVALFVAPAFSQTSTSSTSGLTSTGTASYVPKFITSKKIGNSVIFESSGKIGIGTASPAYNLSVSGSALFSGSTGIGCCVDNNYMLMVQSKSTGLLRLINTGFADMLTITDGGFYNFSNVNTRVGIGDFAHSNNRLSVMASSVSTENILSLYSYGGTFQILNVKNDGNIILNSCPTSSVGLPSGAIWNSSGTLKIAP